ncbi:MAG: tetratricopeptide repeat protein, partial [Acidiferrobacterales bacterium]
MRGYTTRDVAELLGLSEAKVRSFARAGFLSAKRGTRHEYRFSFQDIVLLRTAQELFNARIPAKRIWRALRGLRRQLPNGQPLTTVRIAADGDRIIVRDKEASWYPESGQVVFDFSVSDLAQRVAPLARKAAKSARQTLDISSEDWYNIGVDCETVTAFAEAKAAYRRATDLDPRNTEAHINLGRLLHADGRVHDAESHYRQAAAVTPDNATVQFNLGVALEDLGQPDEAIRAYQQAVSLDPEFA